MVVYSITQRQAAVLTQTFLDIKIPPQSTILSIFGRLFNSVGGVGGDNSTTVGLIKYQVYLYDSVGPGANDRVFKDLLIEPKFIYSTSDPTNLFNLGDRDNNSYLLFKRGPYPLAIDIKTPLIRMEGFYGAPDITIPNNDFIEMTITYDTKERSRFRR